MGQNQPRFVPVPSEHGSMAYDTKRKRLWLLVEDAAHKPAEDGWRLPSLYEVADAMVVRRSRNINHALEGKAVHIDNSAGSLYIALDFKRGCREHGISFYIGEYNRRGMTVPNRFWTASVLHRWQPDRNQPTLWFSWSLRRTKDIGERLFFCDLARV